jgi:hypothetical protein
MGDRFPSAVSTVIPVPQPLRFLTPQRSLAKNLERCYAGRQLILNSFCNGEPEIMGHADFEPLPPVCGGIRVPEFSVDPHLFAAHFDWAGRCNRRSRSSALLSRLSPGTRTKEHWTYPRASALTLYDAA